MNRSPLLPFACLISLVLVPGAGKAQSGASAETAAVHGTFHGEVRGWDEDSGGLNSWESPHKFE